MKKLKKIIFIDDEATNATHKKVAKQADVAEKLLFFTTAEHALEYLSEIATYEFPELIFTEVRLPDMSGHTFIEKVSQLPLFNHEHTQIICLIDTLTNSDVAASKTRMKHVYFKTLSIEELTAIVKEHCPPVRKQ